MGGRKSGSVEQIVGQYATWVGGAATRRRSATWT
jgi:hypothetical protein